MDVPSKRVADFLRGHSAVDFEVVHIGSPKCPAPYAVVSQAGGDFQVAVVEVEVFDHKPEDAVAAAQKVRGAMKGANIGGSFPSLEHWAEAYVVPADGVALTGVGMRYNLPVYQER